MKQLMLLLLFPFWVIKVLVLFFLGLALFLCYALLVVFSVKSVQQMSDFFSDWFSMTFRYFQ